VNLEINYINMSIIDIPVDSVTKKRECIDRDYRTKGNQIIGNLCIYSITFHQQVKCYLRQ